MIEFADPSLVQRELVLLPEESIRVWPTPDWEQLGRPDGPGPETPSEDESPPPEGAAAPEDEDVGATPPGQGTTAPLAGRITLGGPSVVRLTPDELAADPELARYAAAEAGRNTYHLVTLAITFAPEPRRPRIEYAHVALDMVSKTGAPAPVAHSMDPMRIADPVQVSKSRILGPQLSLLGVDASIGEIGRSVKFVSHQPLVQALGLQTSSPGWELRRNQVHELSGCHRLALVVRAPADADTTMSVTVSAGAKVPLLRRYIRRLPDSLRLEASW
ncbi:hypothetical protein [[Kitasatospora] papulosa]|uniref:hypothetical protein n=1 Tax=[Kitasatospora] papulosa TaxID=1464011 RepID=UPI003684F4A1